ncbi:MAG: hypothetical protein WKF84_06505 [Pyrinomonadaceae bacterium]
MIVGSAKLIINAAIPAELPVAGQVIINEVVISSANSASQIREDFIELFNKTNRPLDISGLNIWFRPAGTAAVASSPSVIALPGSVGSKTTIIAPSLLLSDCQRRADLRRERGYGCEQWKSLTLIIPAEA